MRPGLTRTERLLCVEPVTRRPPPRAPWNAQLVIPLYNHRRQSTTMANPLLIPPRPPEPFIGRVKELEWVDGRIDSLEQRFREEPIVVTGEGGVGKTSLVAKYFSEKPPELEPLWVDCKDWAEGRPELDKIFRDRHSIARERRGLSVVLDGADDLPGLRVTELFRGVKIGRAHV